jgi:hypothetical protein
MNTAKISFTYSIRDDGEMFVGWSCPTTEAVTTIEERVAADVAKMKTMGIVLRDFWDRSEEFSEEGLYWFEAELEIKDPDDMYEADYIALENKLESIGCQQAIG